KFFVEKDDGILSTGNSKRITEYADEMALESSKPLLRLIYLDMDPLLECSLHDIDSYKNEIKPCHILDLWQNSSQVDKIRESTEILASVSLNSPVGVIFLTSSKT
ncbi:7322_t:CDS:2, partial [Dentiscutata heterogama]